jgi:hypothetical protein
VEVGDNSAVFLLVVPPKETSSFIGRLDEILHDTTIIRVLDVEEICF